MKSIKKLMALVLSLTLLVTCFAACGSEEKDTPNTDAESVNEGGADDAEGGSSDGVTLKIWVPSEETEITATMMESFKDAHPEYADVTFDITVMGVDDSCDAIKQDADAAADVFLYPSGGIAELTAAGLLYPITYGADEITAIHGEAAIKSCTMDGYLYGVPHSPNSWFMYYNSSMYTEEEVQSLETMMAKDLGDGVYNFSCAISDSWYLSAFFFAAGCTLYGEDGTEATECSWNDATGYKVGEYLIDLVNNNTKFVNDADGLAGSLMSEGKLGALCSGTWSAETLKEALGDNYAACKLPTINIDGTDYQLSNFADFKAFGVNTRTENPQLAMEVAAWLGNEESQLIRYESIATAPTVTSLADNPTVAASVEIAALTEQTNYSTPNPTTSQLSEYWTPAAAFGSGVVNGDITRDNLQESLDSMVISFTTKLAE